MPRTNSLDWIDDELAALAQQQLLRVPRAHTGPLGPRTTIDSRECINFGSNDYLSLAGDPRLAAAARDAIETEGWGSAASPLVAGRSTAQQRLEARLAQFEGTEAALVFPTGFAANLATIAALVGRGDLVLADELNHASLIDGCRLSRAEIGVYPHGDVGRLESLLRGAAAARRKLIVTDALFSMDGDLAPLVEIATLARRHSAMLLVDEAHATGVFGARGRGVAEHLGVEDDVPVRVGTLSKALGGAGGFVCGSRSLVNWLANRARAYVFSTAPPAAVCAAAEAALDAIAADPGRGTRLVSRAARLRERLAAQGWETGRSASPIVPVVVGSPERALDLAARLFERGLYVPAIRPPSVPPGQSRLRISLTAGHSDAMIDELVAALGELAALARATAAGMRGA